MIRRMLLLICFLFFSARAIQSQQDTLLETRITIERELHPASKHVYYFPLQADEYLKLTATQHSLDLLLRLVGPDRQPISEFDSELRMNGVETAEFIAAAAGIHRIEVESKSKSAGRYEIRLREHYRATRDELELENARKLLADSKRLHSGGKTDEALAAAEKALALREKVLGPEHLEVAAVLHFMADIQYQSQQYKLSEDLYERALSIREKQLPVDHPYLAESLVGLAIVYFVEGEYSQVESMLNRAVEIQEQAYGPEHSEVGRVLVRLANVYFHSSDYVQAESLYRRCLSISEKSNGENHPTFAKTLGNLANTYVQLGDYSKAEPMFLRAMAILEKLYGADSQKLATGFIQMGELYLNMVQYSKAEAYFQRAVNSMEPGDWGVVVALTDLATVYFRQGDYTRAESLYKDVLARKEKLQGPDHPRVALALASLADVYRAQGDFTQAEPLYDRAIAIYEKAVDADSTNLIQPLNGLAILHRAKQNIAQSIVYQSRANEIIEDNLEYTLVVGSERQKLIYVASLSENSDRTLSLHIQAAPEDPDAKVLAATTVLQRKGRVLDWMVDRMGVLRDRLTADDQLLVDELSQTTTQLANLVLNGPDEVSLTEHQQKVKELEDKREKIESEISQKIGSYHSSETITLSSIQASLPADAALIEFAVYRSFDPKAPAQDKAFGEPRYVAYIVTRQNIEWKELGEVKKINGAIEQFSHALRKPKSKDSQRHGRILDAWIMQPIRPLLGNAKQLLISPDGALNFLSFDALVDEQNSYLIERFSTTYLTSGRDLFRMQDARNSKSSTVVVANPIFGDPASVDSNGSSAASQARMENITTGSDLRHLNFTPLIGTYREAQEIGSLFEEVNLLTGTQATESSLKKIEVPRILHIATHGFFLKDTQGANLAGNPTAIRASAKIENPLLRSGLALAGANLRKSSGDDGILTALEASSLNLWGTKLVTLSACDTGLGEVRNGEGVYGLRRAFVLAGAETLIMTLWPVSDEVTRDTMSQYYKNLKQGLGRREALRKVQLSMLHQMSRAHPFYWAGFIHSGDWSSLDGKK